MEPTSPRESPDPALAGIWARNLPVTRERVAALERAARSHGRGERLDRPDPAEAAHKLAGSLGSFGLARGSEIARELEGRLSPGANPGDAAEVERLVAELRLLIDG